uniref:hypothetical protein n=1 Tax=Agathobacter sp. TaxID=2021311 RepID=UPI004055E72C
MREYRLRITGVEDFIIISPEVLGLLLRKIIESDSPILEIPAESIMPPGYTQYLLKVLNTNRENKLFRFSQIEDVLLKTEHIYRIIEHQMQGLKIESDDCFKKIVLHVDNFGKSMEYEVETKDSFFCICKNENNKFTYIFPDERQERILIEWDNK